jgi:cytokinin dehydrogenase
MDWQSELTDRLESRVSFDEPLRRELSTDFGRVYEHQPAAVVRPDSAQDVAATLQFAGRRSLTVTARGVGHSQNGQSLSDQILLDMRGLDRILQIDPERRFVVCQAGVTWRALLERLLPIQLSPPVLTNNLDVTVGGTLSTAGLGVASWKYGTQADRCLELEAVTGQGEIVRCSPRTDAELFGAVRAGLGQFGVITEATLELRVHKPRFRSFYLVYDELAALLNDLKVLMDEERFDHLESWCVPLPQGFTTSNARARIVAEWFFPLHATLEMNGAPEPRFANALEGLKFYKHVHTEEGELGHFFRRLDPLFALWKRGGFWAYPHPWMECILPWTAAVSYISQILRALPVELLQGGHVLLWPAQNSVCSVPLFMRPEGEYLLGFGILLAVPKPLLGQVLPVLDQASNLAIELGGKRYLSGWLNFDGGLWRRHYGSRWPEVMNLKDRYDPWRVLKSGLNSRGPVSF